MCQVLRYPDLAQITARAAVVAARATGDPVRLGMAQVKQIGAAPRDHAWDALLAIAEKAAPDGKGGR